MITILKWIPASGKTTLAKSIIEENPETVWVNKDSIRKEKPWLKEWAIDEVQRTMIVQAIRAGKDVVVDNTHCNWKTLDSIIKYCESLCNKVLVRDIFLEWIDRDNLTKQEGLERCIARNLSREEHVPESVIHEMFLQCYPLIWDVVIVDLDWTLCNIDHRLHHVQAGKKDRKSFFEWMTEDGVNDFVWRAMVWLSHTHRVVLCSGRPDNYCKQTVQWLKDYQIEYDHLLMRHHRDNRPDTVVKKDMYDKCLASANVVLAIDDRMSIIDMRQENWIPVLAVNWGRDF